MARPSSSDVSERASDEPVTLTTNAMTAASPVPTLRRRMLLLWVRSAFQIAIALSIPLSVPALSLMLDRVFNPRYEREEIARALERKARSEGDVVVLPSGEIRRAVVYTPAGASPKNPAAHRTLSWWSRLIAAALLIEAIRQTLRLRRAPVEQAAVSLRKLGPE